MDRGIGTKEFVFEFATAGTKIAQYREFSPKKVPSYYPAIRLSGVDEELKAIARSLVWWKPAEEVSDEYLIRRVMNLGTWPMVKAIERIHGETALRRALETAEPGEFSERAWNYWHLRFGIRPTPPLPRREIPFIPLPYVLAQSDNPASSPTRAVAETPRDS